MRGLTGYTFDVVVESLDTEDALFLFSGNFQDY